MTSLRVPRQLSFDDLPVRLSVAHPNRLAVLDRKGAGQVWWAMMESNHRPRLYQSRALTN